jgi:glycerol-3-phosphate dehydrogenase (NAD(P)+)
VAAAAQRVLNGPTFRVYTSEDVVGVEMGGALKNVVALAAGVSDGIGLGSNTKAALATRGLAEITRLGRALGARSETFAGLSGMGDILLTCTGPASRNRRVGERIGRGERLSDILASMVQVAEGVYTCDTARALAREKGVRMPIADAVHAVLREGKPPADAVRELMDRDPRAEQD